MKKIVIVVLIVVLAIIATIVGYSITKYNNKDSNDSNIIESNSNVSTMANSNKNNQNQNQNQNVNSSNRDINNQSSSNTVIAGNNENSSENNNSNNDNQGSSLQNISSNQVQENNNKSNNQANNSSSNSNNTINIANYMGTWIPTMEAQWNEVNNTNEIPTNKELENSKLIMTPEKYSFNGLTIDNPEYKIVAEPASNIFANAHMGDYGNTNVSNKDNSKIGIPKTPYSDLYYIVAYKKGQSLSSVEYNGGGFMIDYPYILNGQVFALVNKGAKPIYKFTKE